MGASLPVSPHRVTDSTQNCSAEQTIARPQRERERDYTFHLLAIAQINARNLGRRLARNCALILAKASSTQTGVSARSLEGHWLACSANVELWLRSPGVNGDGNEL